jgi:osmotically inducible lipoprotein OsmB
MCGSRQTAPTISAKLDPSAIATFEEPDKVMTMRTIQRTASGAILFAALLGLGACAGMSTRDKNTAIGAGAGAVGGAVLTGGSTIGTVGGAAVGGLIGNQIDKK